MITEYAVFTVYSTFNQVSICFLIYEETENIEVIYAEVNDDNSDLEIKDTSLTYSIL